MFSVGFHPTKPDRVSKTLIITSPQLPLPLRVELSGEGIAMGSNSDAGPPGGAGLSSTSFYACGGCTTGDPSSALAVLLAALAAVVPRRRRTG